MCQQWIPSFLVPSGSQTHFTNTHPHIQSKTIINSSVNMQFREWVFFFFFFFLCAEYKTQYSLLALGGRLVMFLVRLGNITISLSYGDMWLYIFSWMVIWHKSCLFLVLWYHILSPSLRIWRWFPNIKMLCCDRVLTYINITLRPCCLALVLQLFQRPWSVRQTRNWRLVYTLTCLHSVSSFKMPTQWYSCRTGREKNKKKRLSSNAALESTK